MATKNKLSFKDKMVSSAKERFPKLRKVKVTDKLTIEVPCDANGEICNEAFKAFLFRTVGLQKVKKHQARKKVV